MPKTGDQILVGIKRRMTIPQSQPLLLNDDILAVADDVIKSRLVPVLMSMRQDFFVVTKDVPIVAGQVEYDIPHRAVGRTLRDLKRKVDGTNKVDVTLVGIEDEHFSALTGIPSQFYFKGDKVCLSPKPSGTVSLVNQAAHGFLPGDILSFNGTIYVKSSTTSISPSGVVSRVVSASSFELATYGDVLEMWYELMPSQLTTTDKAGRITSIGTLDVTLSSVPSAIQTGSSVDIVAGVSGCSTKAIDLTVTNIASNTVHLSSLPSDLRVGDYLTEAGYSPVMQLPDECYPYLETETCYRLLQSISDYEGAKFLQTDIEVELKNLKMLLEPRIQGEATKIIPRMGLARGARSRWKWGFLR